MSSYCADCGQPQPSLTAQICQACGKWAAPFLLDDPSFGRLWSAAVRVVRTEVGIPEFFFNPSDGRSSTRGRPKLVQPHTTRSTWPHSDHVHGEMIRATIRQSFRSRDARIRLPHEDGQKVLEATDALGGRETWGVRTNADGSEVVDPGLFVELLFPKVLTLLNAVMEGTPGGGGPRP
jgi:hypothetical protein